jgi:hypothetical protein
MEHTVNNTHTMQQDTIRARAVELWERRGRPEGYDAEFWLQAERELTMGTNSAGVSANADAPASGSGSDGPMP